MVMVKCVKRNDDCQYTWNYIGYNHRERKRICCPSCHFNISKEKAIRAYNEWKIKNKKEAKRLERELFTKVKQNAKS